MKKLWAKRPTAIQIIMFLIIAASTPHLAEGFNSLESAGNEWRGWLQAIGFDGGVIVVERAITRYVGDKRLRYVLLWAVLIAFVATTTLVRLDGAVATMTGVESVSLSTFGLLDDWQFAKVVLLAGIIPLVVVALAFSGDSQNKNKEGASLATIQAEQKLEVVENHAQNVPTVAIEKLGDGAQEAVETISQDDVTVFSQLNIDPRLLPAPKSLANHLQEAVLLYAAHKSYSEAAKFSKYSRETIRKQVAEALQVAPDWVAIQLQGNSEIAIKNG